VIVVWRICTMAISSAPRLAARSEQGHRGPRTVTDVTVKVTAREFGEWKGIPF
jgi:hypothetical protein